MKIAEVVQTELNVERDTGTEIHLKDPKTGVKTVVPKSPTKPGTLAVDDQGNVEIDLNNTGSIDNKLRPGSKVKVKNDSSKPGTQPTKPTQPIKPGAVL